MRTKLFAALALAAALLLAGADWAGVLSAKAVTPAALTTATWACGDGSWLPVRPLLLRSLL